MATEHGHESISTASWDDDEHDDLDDLIAETVKQHPEFAQMLEDAMQRRLAAIARGEDPNDIPWGDEEAEAEARKSAPEQPAAPQAKA